jgi:hypothetical protein
MSRPWKIQIFRRSGTANIQIIICRGPPLRVLINPWRRAIGPDYVDAVTISRGRAYLEVITLTDFQSFEHFDDRLLTSRLEN